ncbi:hypothetical protein M902_2281 [Bacteriovorax sp. BAL6_X]|uniref:hypothetical protein n=1 Tax=Bacteriovorax sp. BAL6_X TaxID=1201290 RepID=UPI000386EBB9|nr:hypothetical protein [Bacteriovorax sp. BAL6_X]EPZ52369.1 hypothetical protein M902_2281 [Bacteriovorax sp. BAL6_X]
MEYKYIYTILIFILVLEGCQKRSRTISSVGTNLQVTKGDLTAHLVSRRLNGQRVVIEGQCSNDIPVYFISNNLVSNQSTYTQCLDGEYRKTLFFQSNIVGNQDVFVTQDGLSIVVKIPNVVTRRPDKVIVDTPMEGYFYGRTIYVSGRCQPSGTIFIRGSYIEDYVKTAGCPNGLFLTPIYFSKINAEAIETHLFINQVDAYGNSSDVIIKTIKFRNDDHSIFLSESIVGVLDDTLEVKGSCKGFERVSVDGNVVNCYNDRFTYNLNLLPRKKTGRILYQIPVEGLKGDFRSNLRMLFYYYKVVESSPHFFSPRGKYDESAKGRHIISGTCGITYTNGNVRLYTKKSENILRDGHNIPLRQIDGVFIVFPDEYDLDGETTVFAECNDFYIDYKTNHFSTTFDYIPSSEKRLAPNEVDVYRMGHKIEGRCSQGSSVRLLDIVNENVEQAKCINGNFSIDVISSQISGKNQYEIFEVNLFDNYQGAKELIDINYNHSVAFPYRFIQESPVPGWGSKVSPIRFYWNYPYKSEVNDIYYGYYSKNSYIQVEWMKLPQNTNQLLLDGHELHKLGYNECDEVQVYFQTVDKKNRKSFIIETNPIRFDFTPPDEVEVEKIDYSPLFRKQLPKFHFKDTDDNCVNDENLFYKYTLYQVVFSKENEEEIVDRVTIDEFTVSKLLKASLFNKKYDLEGNYQVGVTVLDRGQNATKEYLSVIFSWK